MSIYRHKKRKTLYRIAAEAKLQTELPAPDNTHLVIYRSSETGDFYARPESEFFDGRFEYVEEEELPVSPPGWWLPVFSAIGAALILISVFFILT